LSRTRVRSDSICSPEPLKKSSSGPSVDSQVREVLSPSLLLQTVQFDPSGSRTLPPLPIELDITQRPQRESIYPNPNALDRTSCRSGDLFLEAVVSFADTMEDHLKTVIKNTISIALNEKQHKGVTKHLQTSQIPGTATDFGIINRSRSNSDTSSGELSALRSPSFDSSDTPPSMSYKKTNSAKPIDRELLAFVQRFRKTQMFCLHCEVEVNRKKQEQQKLHAENGATDISDINRY